MADTARPERRAGLLRGARPTPATGIHRLAALAAGRGRSARQLAGLDGYPRSTVQRRIEAGRRAWAEDPEAAMELLVKHLSIGGQTSDAVRAQLGRLAGGLLPGGPQRT